MRYERAEKPRRRRWKPTVQKKFAALLTRDEEVELAKQIERGGPEAGEAIERFVECNRALVLRIAARCVRERYDIEELEAVGMYAVVKAAEKFQWRLGFKFSTLATPCIWRDIKRYIAQNGCHGGISRETERLVAIYRNRFHLFHLKHGRPPTLGEVVRALNISVGHARLVVEASNRPPNVAFGEDRGTGKLQCPLKVLTSDEHRRYLERIIAEVLEKALTPQEKYIIEKRFGVSAEAPAQGEKAATLGELGTHFSVTKERIRQIQNHALGKLKNYPALLELFEQLSVPEEP